MQNAESISAVGPDEQQRILSLGNVSPAPSAPRRRSASSWRFTPDDDVCPGCNPALSAGAAGQHPLDHCALAHRLGACNCWRTSGVMSASRQSPARFADCCCSALSVSPLVASAHPFQRHRMVMLLPSRMTCSATLVPGRFSPTTICNWPASVTFWPSISRDHVADFQSRLGAR